MRDLLLVFVLGMVGLVTPAYATDIQSVKIESDNKDKHHDDKDNKHDLDIDDLKTKDLSKKARISALELAVQGLQAEIAAIQTSPGDGEGDRAADWRPAPSDRRDQRDPGRSAAGPIR